MLRDRRAAHDSGGGHYAERGHHGESEARDPGGSTGDGEEVEAYTEQQSQRGCGCGSAENASGRKKIEAKKEDGQSGHVCRLEGGVQNRPLGGAEGALIVLAGEGLVSGGEVEQAEKDGGAGVERSAQRTGEMEAQKKRGMIANDPQRLGLHETDALELGPCSRVRVAHEKERLAVVAEFVLYLLKGMVLEPGDDFGGGIEVEIQRLHGGEAGKAGFDAVADLPGSKAGHHSE